MKRKTTTTAIVEIRKWQNAGVVLGVIGALIGIILGFATIVHFVFQKGMEPFNQKIEKVNTDVNARIDAESVQRAKSDSIRGRQIETVARMVITPDSSARAILMERVQENSPGGK